MPRHVTHVLEKDVWNLDLLIIAKYRQGVPGSTRSTRWSWRTGYSVPEYLYSWGTLTAMHVRLHVVFAKPLPAPPARSKSSNLLPRARARGSAQGTPAQEVAAYTASLGGGAEVLTSCDAVAADPAACADPEAKIGCCASCSEKQEARVSDDTTDFNCAGKEDCP